MRNWKLKAAGVRRQMEIGHPETVKNHDIRINSLMHQSGQNFFFACDSKIISFLKAAEPALAL